MKQLTIRGFGDDLTRRIQRLANREGISLNQAVLRLLRRGAGLGETGHIDNVGTSLRAILLGDMANSMRLPGAQVPKVGLEQGRLMRDLKVQESVYVLLTQQLEQAKIGEAQDTPVVQVLDRAVPAIRKSKPKIKLNMALAGAVSLFLGIFLAFFLEYIQRQRSLERANS